MIFKKISGTKMASDFPPWLGLSLRAEVETPQELAALWFVG
jgi:hypothetical protein